VKPSFSAFAERQRLPAAVIIVAIALFGMLSSNVPTWRVAVIAPLSYFSTVVGDAGAAFILFAIWRDSRAPRSIVVLAVSFAVCSILACLAMLVLPLLPTEPPMIAAPLQSGAWLYTCWHIAAAFGALAYVAMHQLKVAQPSRRFVQTTCTAGLTFVFVSVIIAFHYSNDLPPLVVGETILGLRNTGTGLFAAGLLAVAAVLMFCRRNPSSLDRALSLSLLALMLDVLLALTGGARFSISYYCARLLIFCSSWFVLLSALQTLFAANNRVRYVEEESRKRAGRIRALLALSSVTLDELRYTTMLQIATDAIRPGKVMLGLLSHLEGDTMVTDATSWTSREEAGPIAHSVYPGTTFPFERTLQSLLHEQRAQAWNDLSFLQGHDMLCDELSVRSVIGTPLMIGRRKYYLMFASTEVMTSEPFADDDIAYVDVVAAHFASRFIQEHQFERIQFQIEHDALTGLENRVQFRKNVREAISVGEAFAVAFVDLDGFRYVNERHGHQFGDEVLVEVAAELGSVSMHNLVARMSADEFAILLRGAGSFDALANALKPYAEIFSTPFHTGDRDGTRMLSVQASIGGARFPDDGNSGEELTRRATVALGVAKSRGGSRTLIFDESMEPLLDGVFLPP
jgi:diguanylate cyclase (GGDEF)-like protein